jgi:dihydropteroate synthase
MPTLKWPDHPPPWIMGILNVTPDSFSDGGQFLSPEPAIDHARRMIDDGADIIDVGGESTRPGALPVEPDEQIRRIVPVIAEIRRSWNGPISIDTTNADVARSALDAGGSWINDISALGDDRRMAGLIAQQGCPIVLMHMQGTPRNMQEKPTYTDVVGEVRAFLRERAKFAGSFGIAAENIIIDPGIGFGKTLEHNLSLLSRLTEIVALGYPVLVGASRKSFIGKISGPGLGDRLAGSLMAAVESVRAGARIVRVHDVAPTRQALAVAAAISHL